MMKRKVSVIWVAVLALIAIAACAFAAVTYYRCGKQPEPQFPENELLCIQCGYNASPQNGGEVETITGILPYDGGYAFDLKSGSFVYRVIAEWDDGNRVEYGFIGKWL